MPHFLHFHNPLKRLFRGIYKHKESFLTQAFKEKNRVISFLQDPRHFTVIRWRHFLDQCYVPKIFYDIGANDPFSVEGQQILFKPLMPHTQFYLFEAMSKHEPALIRSGEPYAIVVLGEHDGAIKTFYETKASLIGTGDSYYLEKTPFYSSDSMIMTQHSTKKLDTLVKEKGWPFPDFMKLDTQGSELDILRGATRCLANTNAIQIESNIQQYNEGAPLFQDVLAFMQTAGFCLYDLVQFHFNPHGVLFQTDMMFIRHHLLMKGKH
ncbi:MAG: FkbM family methyltransferase [Candidatus Aureabacteria bacterium]|nr:FkbM family methyltransferase [Candidatus Auribacterota bacterium]